MAQKKIFTVAQPAMHNMVKGVFTNKKDLFDTITEIPKIDRIEFKDVLQYETKKFNYINVLNLLKISHVNDTFRLKLYPENDGMPKIIEIAVKQTNSKLEI